jgi:hypothetical protein
MLTKFTEYEVLFLLRYEETFNSLTKSYATMNNKINLLQGGVNANRFLVPLTNLERYADLFGVCSRLSQDQLSRTGGFS